MPNPEIKPKKVLIVDDSAFVRVALSQIINSDKQLEVVGMAKNGAEGVELAAKLKPDVITMDVIMPIMGGFEAVRQIKKISSAKILMVSSLTDEGANATFEALSLGAVDFITKSTGDSASSMVLLKDSVISKIKNVCGLLSTEQPPVVQPAASPKSFQKRDAEVGGGKIEILGIGTSTGGPKALQEMLPFFEEDFPVPGLIVQHMPKEFIEPFAERLNKLSKVSIMTAKHGQTLVPGQFLIAPGNVHMKLKRKGSGPATINLDPEPSDSLHRPSVDQTFLSIAQTYSGTALGVILTGMGHDGLLGAREMKKNNSRIFAQDEESCIVFGMPRAIAEANLADKILPLDKMQASISKAIREEKK